MGIPSPATDERAHALASYGLRLILIVLAVTSVNIAIPSLQRRLDAGAAELLWIIDIYALAFAGTLPPPVRSATDSDARTRSCGSRTVRRRCALRDVSTSTGQVIGARAVMGVAAGFVMPGDPVDHHDRPSTRRLEALRGDPSTDQTAGVAAATDGRAHETDLQGDLNASVRTIRQHPRH